MYLYMYLIKEQKFWFRQQFDCQCETLALTS